MTHEVHERGWVLSDDSARFDLDRGHRWIAGESDWAAGIPREVFARAVAPDGRRLRSGRRHRWMEVRDPDVYRR